MTRTVVGLVLLLLQSAACRDSPAHIAVGNGDTVVINSPNPVTLPVRVLDSDGDIVRTTRLKYAVGSGTALRALGGDSIICADSGRADLRISAGAISSSVPIICRPIRSVMRVGLLRMVAGGPALPLQISGVGMRGEAVSEISMSVTVDDSSIATFRNGHVYPRQPGWTYLTVVLGDCELRVSIRVRDTTRRADTARARDITALPTSPRRMCAQKVW